MEQVTAKNFEEKYQKGIVVVDFWAPWCGPCQRLGPVFESLSKEIKGALFLKCNVDEIREISQKFGIMSIPCVIVFHNGEEADRIVGFPGEDAFKDMIADAVRRLQ